MRRSPPRPMLLGLVAVLVALAALSGRTAAPALAAGTLDANYQPAGFSVITPLASSLYAFGQTFVAGRSGRVDRAEMMFGGPGADVTVQFELWPTTGGLPSGSALATQQVTIDGGAPDPIWVAATFASPATVVAGQTYAIMVRWVSGAGVTLLGTFGGYAGGQHVALYDSSASGLDAVTTTSRSTSIPRG